MTKATRFTADDKARSLAYLHERLRRGAEVYGVCTRAGTTGNRRYMLFAVVRGQLINITWHVAAVTGYRLHDASEIVIGGYGNDICYTLVYALWGYGKQPRRPAKHLYSQWSVGNMIVYRQIG